MPLKLRAGELWLPAALVLTTATQLRVGGAPVGPGEVMLVLWIVVAAAKLLRRGRIAFVPAARALVLFWAIAAVSLLAGTLSGIGLGVGPGGGFSHDLMAFAFAATALLLFVFQPELDRRAFHLGTHVLVLAVVPLVALLVMSWGFRSVGPLDPWYGFRFRGWAENPNQLALVVAGVPFFAVRLLARTERWRERVRYALLLLGGVVVGLATASDALLAGWVLAAVLAAPVLWVRWARRPTGNYLRAVFLRVAIPLGVLAGLTVAWSRVSGVFAEQVGELYNLGGQGSVRLHFWRVGLEAIWASPVFGLGPGAHSGHMGPFEGAEAHNTFVDWGASTGAIGIVLYLGLLGWLVLRAWHRREATMVVALFSLIVFSALHYVLRQPIFWFTLVAIAAAPPATGAGPLPDRPVRRRGTPTPASPLPGPAGVLPGVHS